MRCRGGRPRARVGSRTSPPPALACERLVDCERREVSDWLDALDFVSAFEHGR
jgi:hypothetical protein